MKTFLTEVVSRAALSARMMISISGNRIADAPRETPQIIVGSERRRTRAVTQTDQRDHVGLRAGDRNRQVLVLLVEAVKEDQLLPTMCGIVEVVHIERDPRRRHGEGVQKLVAQCVTQSPDTAPRNCLRARPPACASLPSFLACGWRGMDFRRRSGHGGEHARGGSSFGAGVAAVCGA